MIAIATFTSSGTSSGEQLGLLTWKGTEHEREDTAPREEGQRADRLVADRDLKPSNVVQRSRTDLTANGKHPRKVKITSKQNAKDAAARASNRSGQKISIYQCPTCGHWHLSRADQAVERQRRRG